MKLSPVSKFLYLTYFVHFIGNETAAPLSIQWAGEHTQPASREVKEIPIKTVRNDFSTIKSLKTKEMHSVDSVWEKGTLKLV